MVKEIVQNSYSLYVCMLAEGRKGVESNGLLPKHKEDYKYIKIL